MLYKVSVIRRIKHASTATCTLPIYMGFLMTEPNSISCTQLAETYNISHDSVNRFLEREDYTPHDLYQEAIQHIDNNKLNNRKDNLQIVTQRINNLKDSISTSKYPGVSWEKSCNKWRAEIRIDGKNKFLGRFTQEIDAAEAYKDEFNKLKE